MIWPCYDLSLSDTYFLYREDQQDQHHRHIEAAMYSWEHLSRNSVALYQPYMCSVNKPQFSIQMFKIDSALLKQWSLCIIQSVIIYLMGLNKMYTYCTLLTEVYKNLDYMEFKIRKSVISQIQIRPLSLIGTSVCNVKINDG